MTAYITSMIGKLDTTNNFPLGGGQDKVKRQRTKPGDVERERPFVKAQKRVRPLRLPEYKLHNVKFTSSVIILQSS